MEITVKDNIKEVTRFLNDVQKKQVPYASSRALNDTAVDGQNSVVAAIPTTFQNRKKWWLKQQPTGIKVKFSKKTDLRARVHTSAYFAEIQEKGGTKTPKSSKNLAVPTGKVPKKYRTSHGAKEMLNANKKVFRTPKGVFRRSGKKNITLLWSFTPSARVPRRFGFIQIVEKVVKRRFSQHFKTRIDQAIASAKPPSRNS
jgi:hypothetical protein